MRPIPEDHPVEYRVRNGNIFVERLNWLSLDDQAWMATQGVYAEFQKYRYLQNVLAVNGPEVN